MGGRGRWRCEASRGRWREHASGLAAACAIVGWGILAVAWGALEGKAASVTAQEAVREAERASELLGMALGEGVKTTLRELSEHEAEWRVEGSSAGFFVSVRTGRVLAVVNLAAGRALQESAGKPTMAEEEALRIAAQALDAVGAPEDLRLEGASLTAPTDGIPQWLVRWRQVWRGVPYEDLFDVFVEMDAATGAIVLLCAGDAPAPPESAEPRLSEAEARAIALEYIEGNGLVLAEPEFAAEVEIAQPEFTWAENSAASRWEDPTRLVWRVEIGRTDEELGWWPYAVVYVDAGTGEVVGDAISGMGAAAARPQAAKGKGVSLLAVGGGVLVALIAGAAAFLWVRRGR